MGGSPRAAPARADSPAAEAPTTAPRSARRRQPPACGCRHGRRRLVQLHNALLGPMGVMGPGEGRGGGSSDKEVGVFTPVGPQQPTGRCDRCWLLE